MNENPTKEQFLELINHRLRRLWELLNLQFPPEEHYTKVRHYEEILWLLKEDVQKLESPIPQIKKDIESYIKHAKKKGILLKHQAKYMKGVLYYVDRANKGKGCGLKYDESVYPLKKQTMTDAQQSSMLTFLTGLLTEDQCKAVHQIISDGGLLREVKYSSEQIPNVVAYFKYKDGRESTFEVLLNHLS